MNPRPRIKKISGIRYEVICESVSYSRGTRGIKRISEDFVVVEEIPDILVELKGLLHPLASNEVRWAGISKPNKSISKKISNGRYQEMRGNALYTYTPIRGYKQYRSDGRMEDCLLVKTKRDVLVG